MGAWGGEILAGFFGFWGALVLLLAVIAIGIAIVADLEALGALLSENVLYSGNVFDAPVHQLARRIFQKSSTMWSVFRRMKMTSLSLPFSIVPLTHQSARTPAQAGIANFDAEYEAPPLSILGVDRGKPGVGDIKANANIIKRTFQNFGINLEMDEVSVGPTVTRYAVKPAEGVRLSKIVSLANNLELALAAHPVRIEAPIPGKSLIGIEVPNTIKAMVGLGGS